MIWFACKKCGKVHGRPVSSAGAMLFCDCGEGLLVPWESTADAPPDPPAAEPAAPPIPVLEPVASPEVPRARRQRRAAERNPSFCLDHDQIPIHAKCGDCGEGFCRDCLIAFQDATLCGPCKNYRVRILQTLAPTSGWSIASLVLALGSCLFTCLLPVLGWRSGITLLLFQTAAFVFGLLGLRATLADARVRGQWLAVTGMVAAAVFAFITMALLVSAPTLNRS